MLCSTYMVLYIPCFAAPFFFLNNAYALFIGEVHKFIENHFVLGWRHSVIFCRKILYFISAFFFQLALICSLQVSRSQGLLNISMQQLPETQFGFINVITNYIHVSLEPGTILGMTLSLGSVCIIKESVQCILWL